MNNKSKFRRVYINRLIIRIIILLVIIGLYIIKSDSFDIVRGFNFFKKFSILHILWFIWMLDMILQLCKAPKYWPLGSQKFLAHRYLPSLKKIDKKYIKEHMKKLTQGSTAVAITWIIFISIIDTLYLTKIIPFQILVIISTTFYVCDIICVVAWCPFKTFFMHNKCCTTCRIFNWDHAMMFSPLIALPGIWTYSLVIMSFIVLIVWEIACAVYPERFMEKTNCALRCHNCADKLCGKNINNEK